ncbi:MAG: hypothetical protein M3Q56_06425 [Bacteroidota bacterium]|nr:hypothetical protein [Bacteroidota bacterium]
MSGNRQFGYSVDANGKMILYIKGADRYYLPISPSTLHSYLLEKIAFIGGDNLWYSVQNAVSVFVRDHGGETTNLTPIISRPKAKAALLALLYGSTPITNQNICN